MFLNEKWKKQYRDIFELICKDPRIEITTLSEEMKINRETVTNRLNEAHEQGFIIGPQIRKRSYQNFSEYVYLVNCKDPLELFLQYIKNRNITYHAAMEGSPNLWVTSREKISIDGDVFASGLRSDYYMSFPPHHSWETAIKAMNKKGKRFNPEDYQQKGIIQNHWDKTIEWSEEDKKLFRELKYDLRKPLTPIMKKHYIFKDEIDQWLERLPECCSILTSYFPDTISAYDPYLYIFETDYEDFIIDLFSELPTSCLFFKISDKLILRAYIDREFLRNTDLPENKISNLHIPLLVRNLKKRKIIKKGAHGIVTYHWRKDI